MKKLILFTVVIFALIQLIKIDTPKQIQDERYEIKAPSNIKTTLQKSCYDCHSNNYKVPWYGNIAPSSWFVRSHINDGIKVLNFSEFNNYDKTKQNKLYADIIKSIVIRMPLSSYTILHQNAKLSQKEKEEIRAWAIDAKNRL
ncbi:MAG: heme-binding domain-containing protein [Epsilonproteobacteria bacterium]|nr:heme-binding domain-containing protein [Campylobacterota bacterium]